MQALALACSFSEIAVRDRPRVVQLATCDEGYLGLQLQRWFKLPFVVYAHGNEILAAIDSDWDKPRLALKKAAWPPADGGGRAGSDRNYSAGMRYRQISTADTEFATSAKGAGRPGTRAGDLDRGQSS
jgi:hypothetical protein